MYMDSDKKKKQVMKMNPFNLLCNATTLTF